jgi:L-seryl-tRNA(Ser) seleniumtransferase
VAWDRDKIGLTAGDVGRKLLDGEPRIMAHANGEGNSLTIRPVALKPDEYKIIAARLHEIFRSAPKGGPKAAPAPPAVDLAGRWDVEVQYEVGSARHKLFLTTKGHQVTGSHVGWASDGDLRGAIDGDRVDLRSSLPMGGQRLRYAFTGRVSGDSMSGEVDLGEYGTARWTARRHNNA